MHDLCWSGRYMADTALTGLGLRRPLAVLQVDTEGRIAFIVPITFSAMATTLWTRDSSSSRACPRVCTTTYLMNNDGQILWM